MLYPTWCQNQAGFLNKLGNFFIPSLGKTQASFGMKFCELLESLSHALTLQPLRVICCAAFFIIHVECSFHDCGSWCLTKILICFMYVLLQEDSISFEELEKKSIQWGEPPLTSRKQVIFYGSFYGLAFCDSFGNQWLAPRNVLQNIYYPFLSCRNL